MRSRETRLVALVALAMICSACGWIDEGADMAETVVVAQRTDLIIEVPARGELESLNASPIAVPRVPTGALKVKELVEEGTIVEPGQIVVVFDDTELNVDLQNHQATFRSTNREIDSNSFTASIDATGLSVMREVAELERDNIQAFEILDESIYSRQEILEDEVRLDTAEETIVFADASLLLRGEYYDIEERILGVEKDQVSGKIERVEYSLGQLVLKAPIGGLIVYKKNWRGASVAVGDTLWPGNMIMSIVDPTQTALKAFVLERDAAGLAVDTEATVTIDARPQHSYRGKVTSVAEISRPIESGSPVKYSEVKIELVDGEADFLKPGMKGRARIVTGKLQDVVVVPRSAIQGNAEAPFVVVASETGPSRRAVTLGAGDLVRVSIDEGLDGGERLLLGEPDPDLGELPEEPDRETPATDPAVSEQDRGA